MQQTEPTYEQIEAMLESAHLRYQYLRRDYQVLRTMLCLIGIVLGALILIYPTGWWSYLLGVAVIGCNLVAGALWYWLARKED